MKTLPFSTLLPKVVSNITLQGDFVIAYTLRLWAIESNNRALVDEARGSCFTYGRKKIIYPFEGTDFNNSSLELELIANISTIKAVADYCIGLHGTTKFHGTGSFNKEGILSQGQISYHQGGKNISIILPLPTRIVSEIAG